MFRYSQNIELTKWRKSQFQKDNGNLLAEDDQYGGKSDVQRVDLTERAKPSGRTTIPGSTSCHAALHPTSPGGGRSGLQPSNPGCKDLHALLLLTSRPPALVSLCFLVNAEKSMYFFLLNEAFYGCSEALMPWSQVARMAGSYSDQQGTGEPMHSSIRGRKGL